MAHSQFGGSIADRWMNCPGSVALCASVPELPESPYAAEGTRAHAIGAGCLAQGIHNADMVYGGEDVPDDMGPAVQVYLDAVYEEMAKSTDAELYVETTFAFAGAGDGTEVYGSNDAIVYHPSLSRLVVFDYKHGVGVSVSAEDNAQLKFYAAGAYLSKPRWTIKEVVLVIVQPRARDVDFAGAVKPWPMDPVELIDFASEVERGVAFAKEAERVGGTTNTYLRAGSWCRWCDAAAVCPAKEAATLKALTLDYSTINIEAAQLPTIEVLMNDKTAAGPERIAEILRGIEVLTSWANQVREYAEAHMLAGNLEIPGWKVVEKIGRRKWAAGEQDIAQYAGLVFGLEDDDIRPRKLVTLTEFEKQLKAQKEAKDEIDAFMLKFTIKESSGLTIAASTDRREAVNAAEKSFSGVKL